MTDKDVITGHEAAWARELLMTGPRATPPSWKAIRKTVGRLRRGDKANMPWGLSSWRDSPKIRAA